MSPDDLLSRKEAALYLRSQHNIAISAKTLANFAANNNARRGPAFTQFRWRSVTYRRKDLDDWAAMESRRVE